MAKRIKGIQMRDFPEDLARYCKEKYGTDSSRDAIAACLIDKEGLDVRKYGDEKIQELLEKKHPELASRERFEEAVLRRLADLHGDIRNMDTRFSALETAVSYLIFDRLGYREIPVPMDPSNLNMRERGTDQIRKKLRQYGAQVSEEERREKGRVKN